MIKFLRAAGFLFISFCSTVVYAQDDLLKQLESQNTPAKTPVIATFKGFKIINIQTNETNKKRNLDFRIAHLFGNVGAESGGGVHNLYGLDQSNDIRIAFHYGITDALTIGVARAKRNENFEGLAKYRLLQQTENNKIPIALTLFGQSTISARENVEGFYDKFEHRLNYCAQLIIARKFSSRFSMEVVPSWVHRNLVDLTDENDLYSIGGGVRWKFTKSSAIVADYFHNISPTDRPGHEDPIGAGVEIETGGHVFTIMFTNAIGILEDDFLPNTIDAWSKGGFKFSFNISRIFKL